MFNTDGGSTVDSQAVEFGGKVTKPEDPTKEDHILQVGSKMQILQLNLTSKKKLLLQI